MWDVAEHIGFFVCLFCKGGCVCACDRKCCLFNFSLVVDCMFVCTILSHPYKCVSCGLWQYSYNFRDLGNSLIFLESKIDLNHMGDLLVDLTRSMFFSFISIVLLLFLCACYFILLIMVLSFSTFNCRGLQDSFKRKTVFSYFHKKDTFIFYRKHTVLLLMKNFGLPNGAVIHGFQVVHPIVEGWLFL